MRVDKFVIQTMNKRAVIDTIRKDGPINIAEIARKHGLSIPTVMKITDEFIAGGLIRVIGKGDSNGGKRPNLLEFISDACYIVGVDIGRSKLKVVCMDMGGNIVRKEVCPTGETLPEEQLIHRICTLMEQAVVNSGVEAKKIIGVGIGMPGLLDFERGRVLFSPDFEWEDVDLGKPISRFLKEEKGLIQPSVPILIENANRALAMGENWFGAGVSSEYFICINLGHGIGSAIIEEGDFYRGSSDSSGEVGHITLERDGPKCTCGNYGCLEALASGRSIARQAKELVDGGKGKAILAHAGGREHIDAKAVFEAAAKGDEEAGTIVARATEYIGIALASYINILDPDKIILAGGMASAGGQLLNPVKEVAKKRQMRFAGRKVKIETARLGSDATAVGAASLILKKFIEQGGKIAMAKEMEGV